MFSIQDQLSAATRNNVESQFALMTSLVGKTFESVDKLCKLNLAALKASMEESGATFQQLLAAREPREFVEMSVAQVQPNIEKAIAYSRHVAHIASDAQAEIIHAAEVRFDENKRNVAQLVEDLAKNAPAGSQAAVEVVRSVIETTSTGYEQFARTARHAVSVAGGTLDAAVTQVAQTAPQLTPVADTIVAAR